MSYSYFLVCMKCRTGVLLGKAVRRKYEGTEAETTGFTALFFKRGGGSFDSQILDDVECLDHFLMMHRTHELRVLPDSIEKHMKGVDFPESFPVDEDSTDPSFNRLTFLNQPVGKVDPAREADELDVDTIVALKAAEQKK